MKDIDINSKDFKDKISKMNTDFITKLFEKEQKIKEITSDTKYILWLIDFTKNNLEFTDDDYTYFPEKISENDNKHVDELGLFFEVIDRFAEKNYLSKIKCDFGGYYPVRLGKDGFHIGCLVGQGVLYFCRRVEVENEEEFIEYNDIINNRILPHTEELKNSLDELKIKVTKLYRSGMPLEIIKKSVNELMVELEKNLNNKEKPYSLKLK